MSDRLALLTSASFRAFLEENKDAEVTRLLLSTSRLQTELREAADQILSRRKAKDKLPALYSNPAVVFPPPLSVEQSSSQQAAEYKKKLISGDHLIDLTGGMGVDCLALSEGFLKTTYVEQNPWLCEVFTHNSTLFRKPIEVVNEDSEAFLSTYSGRAYFFIDPARRDAEKKKVFRFEDCSPNIISLLPLFREKAIKVLIKAAPLVDISYVVAALGSVLEVHVLSIQNECKEVLFLLDFEFKGEPRIVVVNLHHEKEDSFSFFASKEQQATADFSEPLSFLYEPNAAIRKAGAFKSIALAYGLRKIAPNTHLYTSSELISDFPGRIFEVLHPNLLRPEIPNAFPDGRANVISKNHPLTPEEIRKKFKLKDGGESYLIAFRDQFEKGRMLKVVRVI